MKTKYVVIAGVLFMVLMVAVQVSLSYNCGDDKECLAKLKTDSSSSLTLVGSGAMGVGQ